MITSGEIIELIAEGISVDSRRYYVNFSGQRTGVGQNSGNFDLKNRRSNSARLKNLSGAKTELNGYIQFCFLLLEVIL